jgi:hypothetical protein
MTKTAGSIHAQRGRTVVTLCGRRIVGVTPRPQEVRRDLISSDPTKVTCRSCRANLGLAGEGHIPEKGALR